MSWQERSIVCMLLHYAVIIGVNAVAAVVVWAVEVVVVWAAVFTLVRFLPSQQT